MFFLSPFFLKKPEIKLTINQSATSRDAGNNDRDEMCPNELGNQRDRKAYRTRLRHDVAHLKQELISTQEHVSFQLNFNIGESFIFIGN